MAEKTVRSIRFQDFEVLMRMEEVFGSEGKCALGPYHVRLCCFLVGAAA